MAMNSNQPRKDDVVLGGEAPLPISSAVLGGIEGIKRRLDSNNIDVKTNALSDAIEYGSVGLELVIDSFKNDKSEHIRNAAYLLLRKRTENRVKEIVQNYDYWNLIDYLYRLEGDSHSINCITISPDGQMLFSGGNDGNIKAWNLNTRKLKYTQAAKSGSISSLNISIDGKNLASGSRYSKIKVWDIKPEKIKQRLILSINRNGHGGEISSLAFSANVQSLFSVSPYNSTRHWDLKTKSWSAFEGDKWAANCFAISHDRQSIVTGMHIVNLWDTTTGKLKKTLQPSRSHVDSLAISHDKKTIVGACADKTINIWDVDTGNILYTFNGHSASITSLAITNDGKTLISGSYDRTIKIWNLNNAKLKKTLNGHLRHITCVTISPDGQLIISASRGGEIKIWGLP